MVETFFDGRVIVKHGDITLEDVDAVVNAANWTLLGGGGVDGAIHDAGGPSILEECRHIRETQYPDGLPTGQAVLTTAGLLAAKHVIHTVGPIFGRHDGHEPELLAACYRNSIGLALEHGLESIAFPSISTGAYGYPKHEAAKVVASTIAELAPHPLEIRLVYFSEADARSFIKQSGWNR
jgi:O-acetyl-ADP-ribose deacetylase (regulator of RNase III)